jgi:transcriptional regulator GlxA family with amidase domain
MKASPIPSEPYQVGILLFEEVEVLDFAAPFEVFSVSSELHEYRYFRVATIAAEKKLLRARNGLQIMPDFDFAESPKLDILVIPGGYGTRRLLLQAQVLDWIARQQPQTQITASVCTGALLLGKLGLLDGLRCTTHRSMLQNLQTLAPKALVQTEKRFYDEGAIMTAAGISAGLDLSLHIVHKLFGEECLQKTLDYMELDGYFIAK